MFEHGGLHTALFPFWTLDWLKAYPRASRLKQEFSKNRNNLVGVSVQNGSLSRRFFNAYGTEDPHVIQRVRMV
jgi:hypothetical protein